MLEIQGTKTFGGVQALAGVDRRIAEGGLCCIIGPNGCGKTTLFDVVLRTDLGQRALRGRGHHRAAVLGKRRLAARACAMALVTKGMLPGVSDASGIELLATVLLPALLANLLGQLLFRGRGVSGA